MMMMMMMVCRQDVEDIRDPVAGRYYLMIMAYVLPSFAVTMLLVLLITWRQKLGQLRKDAAGHYDFSSYLIGFTV